MNSTEIAQIGQALAQIAAVAVPTSSTISGLLIAATQLATVIERIKNDPAMADAWAEVERDYSEAAQAFRESVRERG